jgi:pSer/pThr/pTyr-binding forkhead associated (FHA) protein
MWILQSSTPEDPLTFRVSAGTAKTVGRATRADFILHEALVSRLHCRLEASDDALEVVDLSSTNGTYVNGKRIDRARLASGDTLRVGRVELTVVKDVEPSDSQSTTFDLESTTLDLGSMKDSDRKS